MQKIGIYGGTFNPVHLGHVSLAKRFLKALELDTVFLVPTATPPHKVRSDLAGGDERCVSWRWKEKKGSTCPT